MRNAIKEGKEMRSKPSLLFIALQFEGPSKVIVFLFVFLYLNLCETNIIFFLFDDCSELSEYDLFQCNFLIINFLQDFHFFTTGL